MLSDSIIYVGIAIPVATSLKESGYGTVYFSHSSLSKWGVNLSEILKFAGQNSYSERGACNWFYA